MSDEVRDSMDWTIPPLDVIVEITSPMYWLGAATLTLITGSMSTGSAFWQTWSKAMGTGLSIGVCISVGIAMVRVLTGISILWFLIPGYAIALGISFFVPKIYTAIAFDSGGVASGPMTATFLLPLAQGACLVRGGNVVTDAFGIVAMVAMTPLITIQVMGLASRILEKRREKEAAMQPVPSWSLELLGDNDIIEL